MEIRIATNDDQANWDRYLYAHPDACLYHRFGWKHVIEETYGHQSVYLFASSPTLHGTQKVHGILPLISMRNVFFGKKIISIPFFDFAGVLADTPDIEKKLLNKGLSIARRFNYENLEIRHRNPLLWVENAADEDYIVPPRIRRHKVRILLRLNSSTDAQMKSFKSKIRSQIRRPLKAGLTVRIGKQELLDDFWQVFSENMRDLGSPVHSRSMMANTLRKFTDESRIVTVYKGIQPLAASMVISHGHTLENPWASALRKYSRMSPNMLLYWTMIRYAIETGHSWFDFGRSSPDEGTYRFKMQWGSEVVPLYWYYFPVAEPIPESLKEDANRYNIAINVWKRLPLMTANWLGPKIRKHIGL